MIENLDSIEIIVQILKFALASFGMVLLLTGIIAIVMGLFFSFIFLILTKIMKKDTLLVLNNLKKTLAFGLKLLTVGGLISVIFNYKLIMMYFN